jgi:o-succinylbenzoate synthase
MPDAKPWRLHWRRYRLPFRHPVRTAHGVWQEREGVWVQLDDESGGVGRGEAAPLAWFGAGTVEEVESQLESLGPTVTADAWRERGDLNGPVRFALATAEWALTDAHPAPARDHWPVAGLLPAGRAALPALMDQLEAGFRTFKWKVGVEDPADERVLLDDVLSRLPTGARLRLDANGAWDRRTAVRWLEHCADRPIEFVEQPIAPDARGADDSLLGLAGDYPTPIALDESLVHRGDLQRWIELGWPGVWVVKLSLLGDPAEVLPRLQAARADVVFSSALETGLGAAATLAAAFSWAGPVRALGYGVWPLFTDRRWDGPARAPFIRATDLRYDPSETWAGLST